MHCIFCKIACGEVPAFVLWRDATMLVILSLEGHPIVLPAKHTPDLKSLDDATSAALMQIATRVAKALRKETNCDGVNLVLSDGAAAGQDVFHTHLHVVPRWHSDDVVLAWDTATVPDAKRSKLAAALKARLV